MSYFSPVRLRRLRESKRLSLTDVHDATGITRAQLSKIENMRSPYSQGLLEAAAEAYGCTVADLLIRDPTQPDAPWSIYETLKKAPADRQRQIHAVIETLLKTGT